MLFPEERHLGDVSRSVSKATRMIQVTSAGSAARSSFTTGVNEAKLKQ